MSEKGTKELHTVGFGFTWEDYTVGDHFKTLGRTVTETDIVNFVAVTGMNEVLFTDHTFTIGVAAAGRAASALSRAPHSCGHTTPRTRDSREARRRG